ncbi:MAG TPA: Rpn family recombination-promoting nuclease/putative transposase [Candidatus Fusicatenibacter merdavium]|uniref:Rpn family recombination-promoting nuclease/putative transposase n=1 Tax=Candidatus Fusicatenibacter merdavium TaxID=2838600 RepID=A0A9D1XF71_9FIRM|nr:Rpn family recombination-promoting nuclease/putative transposase [Candidatus Fusicatenibacter merdavium]
MTKNNNQNLEARERRIAEARSLNLFSDVFMTAALQDPAACQHVLRILTGIKDLTVKSVRTQYRISRMVSHDAILDVYAEDTDGKLYNIEVQRTDTVNHARRTRFYTSMIDSECLQKGKNYDEMPEVYIIYISRTDLWNAGKTVYPVQKYLGDRKLPYDDGIHILYVNAAVNDHSTAAQLMEFFKTADPDDMSQGDLSRRVHFLKSEEGGYQVMCEISEKWYREGEEHGKIEGKIEGEKNQARRTALELRKMGLSVDMIARAVNFSLDTVKQWLAEGVSPAK